MSLDPDALQELAIPNHPTDFDIQCRNCKHWLSKSAANYVILPQNAQVIPLSALIGTGQRVPPGALSMRAAPCTVNPSWDLKAQHHWCGQFIDADTRQ